MCPFERSIAACFQGDSNRPHFLIVSHVWHNGSLGQILSSLYGPLFSTLYSFCLSLLSCLYFFHSKVKPIGNGAWLAPPVPEFQHTKPSENQSEKRWDAVPGKLQVLATININLAIKMSSSSFFLVLNSLPSRSMMPKESQFRWLLISGVAFFQ